MTTVFLQCMQGIGDQIYSRPFVRKLAEDSSNDVYISTVLPALFSDIPGLKFVKAESKYRTQQKNFSKIDFVQPLQNYDRIIDPFYGHKELRKHGIVSHIEHSFGFDLGSDKIKFDLPIWPDAEHLVDDLIKPVSKKIAIVRPATVRKEWFCSTRNAYPPYIAWCARMLIDAGYFVISIADCAEDEEWIDGETPPAHLNLHKGELGLLGTLTLLKKSHIVVGGSGFIIPATVSADANLFIIFGGRGKYDNPHKVFDLRMNMKKIGWVIPDNFCRCDQMNHHCDKTISNLDDRFYNFMGRT